jgi:DNA-binding NtrC family response regulator
MPLEMQAKILRVVQENEVVRLGEDRARKVDVRIVAATNKDLMEEVQNRNFREDLYFRLNVVEIVIPPLRDRKEDIALLCEHILRRIAAQLDRETIRISDETFRTLEAYHWPGNVRELENALERASIICENGVIQPEHLPRLLAASIHPGHLAHDALRSLREGEQELILRALKECKGNVSESARMLGVSRSTLHRRIREMDLAPHRFR